MPFLVNDGFYHIGMLLMRLFFGAMLLRHGLQKINNFNELSQTFFDPIGLGPKLSLIMIILVEVGCSLLIMSGLMTRLATLVIVFSMFVAAFMAKSQFSMNESEMPLVYLGAFLLIFILGPGRYSLDWLMAKLSCK